MTGKGENILKIENNYQNFFVLLVNPLIEISTKKYLKNLTFQKEKILLIFNEKFLSNTK